MVIICLASLMIGLGLGLRQPVWVLPAAIMAYLPISAIMLATGQSLGRSLTVLVFATVALQLGYLSALFAGHAREIRPPAKSRSESQTNGSLARPKAIG